MNQFKNSFFNKRAIKTILGLTLGTGLSYGVYHFTKQPNIMGDEKGSPQKSQIIAPVAQTIHAEPKEVEITQSSDSESKSQSVAPQTPAQESSQQQSLKPKIDKKHFKQLKQINQFKFQKEIGDWERIMIVADLPYNEQFQAKIIDQVNKMKQKFGDIKIYRKNFINKQVQPVFQAKLKAKIKEQTIFLLKNPYEKGLSNIDFDIFIQFPSLIEAYLKDVKSNDEINIQEVTKRISNLSPHESCLIYLYDKNEPEEKIKQRMLAAKYIEMEMVLNGLSGVKLEVVEKNASISSNLIDLQTARTNSVHLLRKHNLYTPYQPNYYLKTDKNQHIPFHRLSDIALFAKESHNLMITQYLSDLETFDSMASPAPYMCTLRVDRNKISDQDYTTLLKIFGELKRKSVFPDISYSLKLKKIPYSGKDYLKNKEWQITLTNVDELEKQALMHEIKTAEQRQMLGFKESQYLRSSQEYIFEHTTVSYELIKEFFEKAVKDQLPKYYKSEEDHPLAPIRKIVGTQFDQIVLKDQKDHFVYEYSEYCPTCKKISPLISAFAKVVQNKDLGLDNVKFHKIDANKNRVRGQLSSPYIPNIFYYKKEWKHLGPVRFPIELLGCQGLISLYHFCAITNEVKSMEWSNVDAAIKASNVIKSELKDFIDLGV